MEPRSVVDVIPKLLAVIPPTETALINEIDKFKSNLWNQAPEALFGREVWIPLGYVLATHVRSFDEPWQKELLAIFNNTT